jgi:hypothetical protein
MKTRIAIALGLLLGALTGLRGQAATAPLFPSHPTCFELAVVANRFIALGEEGTVAALTRQWNSARHDMTLEDSTREQIGWVCRLIFSQKAKAVLRRPRFGAYWLFVSLEDEDWPFYPLAEAMEFSSLWEELLVWPEWRRIRLRISSIVGREDSFGGRPCLFRPKKKQATRSST